MQLDPYGVPTVGVAELAADQDAFVIDVREAYEFASGHVPGAVSIPMSVLPVRLQDVPRDRRVSVICQSGARSAQVVQWLNPQGYDSVNVAGGTAAWILAGHTVE
ncbi:MAG TPA: rhodanese-like domain-containing protein [Candidatus Nanopelagicales bacterium]|nr:rhodanese-like domain-containing protein [Candidatus Nanopelagicales bacterium]